MKMFMAAVVLAAVVALAPTGAAAQSKCDAGKLTEYGKRVLCLAKADAKAAKTGTPIDPLKQQKCLDKFGEKCARAEAKGDCTAAVKNCAALATEAETCRDAAALPCTAGAPGCPWQPGDVFTRSQLAWDSTTSWYSAYDAVYAATFGLVEVGIPGAAGFSLRFTAPDNVSSFFVQSGTSAALNADLLDTTTSSARQFGGEVLALRMNVDFSAAGALGGSVSFGTLRLCDMTDASLNNVTVDGLLAIANTLLGGGANGYAIAAINDIVGLLDAAFVDGTPSTFAQNNLVNGACP